MHELPSFHLAIPVDDLEKNRLFYREIEHLKKQHVEFEISPYIRFKGKTGEQRNMFFYDPSGNALEFKSFKNKNQLFAK